MQEEGPIVQPLWRSVFTAMDKKVKGLRRRTRPATSSRGIGRWKPKADEGSGGHPVADARRRCWRERTIASRPCFSDRTHGGFGGLRA